MFCCLLENHRICDAGHQGDDVCESLGKTHVKALVATPDCPSGLPKLRKALQNLMYRSQRHLPEGGDLAYGALKL